MSCITVIPKDLEPVLLTRWIYEAVAGKCAYFPLVMLRAKGKPTGSIKAEPARVPEMREPNREPKAISEVRMAEESRKAGTTTTTR